MGSTATTPQEYFRVGTDGMGGWATGTSKPATLLAAERERQGGSLPFGEPAQNHLLARKALEFVRRLSEAPFFLLFSTNAPYGPYGVARRHRDAFSIGLLAKVSSHDERDFSDKPRWVERDDRFGKKA